jgi:Domain of unknown function (DUF4123)
MEPFVQHLSRYLFVGRELNVFAVLDGASVPNLRTSLHIFQPEYECLYRGDLKPDMAQVAPYLVRLEPNSQFTDWVVVDGWGKHWGIFVRSAEDMPAVRRHLRKLLVVHDENGNPLAFRYYDPRVLQVFLPTCNNEQLTSFFGPTHSFLLESEGADALLRLRLSKGALKLERRQLTTEEQENLALERAERERLRQELTPIAESEEELTADDVQHSLVDFWTTMTKYKPPRKPS